jgi:hypothetical protein
MTDVKILTRSLYRPDRFREQHWPWTGLSENPLQGIVTASFE